MGTTYEQEVAARRAAFTADDLAQLAAVWPPSEKIAPRGAGFEPAHYVFDRLPKDEARRIAVLQDRLASAEAELRADRERYDDIRTRGAAALSDYDIGIASTSAAEAVRCALMLKTAHVSFQLSCALALETAIDDATENRSQLLLF